MNYPWYSQIHIQWLPWLNDGISLSLYKYKGKTINYLTKQTHYSNFESLIYGLIIRFSINWILKTQFSKLVWYVTQLCISVSSYIVMNFHSILLKSKTKKRILAHIFLTHLGLVSHICDIKISSHLPSDAYMRHKSLYFFYRPRGRPTKQCQAKMS